MSTSVAGRRRALHAAALAALGFGAPAWLIQRAAAADARAVRIGSTRDPANAPLMIAIDAGYFKTEGVAPVANWFRDERAAIAALIAGQVDLATTSLDLGFYRTAFRHDLRIIAARSMDQTRFPIAVLLVSAKAHAAGLGSPASLAGARIAITDPGASGNYALVAIARRFGVDPASIRTVPFRAQPLAVAALAHGTVDAVLMTYPEALRVGRRGDALIRLSDFVQWQQGVVVTTAAMIANRRERVAAFVRGYQRGTGDYRLNFLEYDDGGDFIPGPRYEAELALIAAETHVAPAVVIATKTFCDRRANLDVADIGRQVEFWRAREELDPAALASTLVDPSFIGEEQREEQPPAAQ